MGDEQNGQAGKTEEPAPELSVIRKSRHEDFHDLLLLAFEQYHAEFCDVVGLGFNVLANTQISKDLIDEKYGVTHVLEINNKLQGFCSWKVMMSLTDLAQPMFYQIGLYIRPEFRKKGFGSALIDAGELWADEKRIKIRILGSVATGSPDYLKDLYGKKGFFLYEYKFFKNKEL